MEELDALVLDFPRLDVAAGEPDSLSDARNHAVECATCQARLRNLKDEELSMAIAVAYTRDGQVDPNRDAWIGHLTQLREEVRHHVVVGVREGASGMDSLGHLTAEELTAMVVDDAGPEVVGSKSDSLSYARVHVAECDECRSAFAKAWGRDTSYANRATSTSTADSLGPEFGNELGEVDDGAIQEFMAAMTLAGFVDVRESAANMEVLLSCGLAPLNAKQQEALASVAARMTSSPGSHIAIRYTDRSNNGLSASWRIATTVLEHLETAGIASERVRLIRAKTVAGVPSVPGTSAVQILVQG